MKAEHIHRWEKSEKSIRKTHMMKEDLKRWENHKEIR